MCALDGKQQIDELICHLVWREKGFFVVGGRRRSTFPIQKSQSISALSWDAPHHHHRGSRVSMELCVGGGAETLALVFLCLFRSRLDSSPLSSPSTGSFVASKVSLGLRLPPVVL